MSGRTNCTYSILGENNFIFLEENGCWICSYGCKEHEFISKMIQENCRKNGQISEQFRYIAIKTLILCHTVLYLRNTHIFLDDTNFLKYRMGLWKAILYLNHIKYTAKTIRLNIRRFIFQETACNAFCSVWNEPPFHMS